MLLFLGGFCVGAIFATFAYAFGAHLAVYVRDKAKQEEDARMVQDAYDELRQMKQPPVYQFYTRES